MVFYARKSILSFNESPYLYSFSFFNKVRLELISNHSMQHLVPISINFSRFLIWISYARYLPYFLLCLSAIARSLSNASFKASLKNLES